MKPSVPASSTEDWKKGLADLTSEHGFEPMEIKGGIPESLSGTLYRNGPAVFERFGRRVGHLFDGDGAVSAVRIDRGTAHGAVRVVMTEGLNREHTACRPLYGGWGTPVPGLLRGFQGMAKSPANTSVIMNGGCLYALYEGGLPYELDPANLSTVGKTDFKAELRVSFSAHPRYLASRRAWYGFGARYNVLSYLDLYEWKAGGALKHIGAVRQPGTTIVHDFAVTDRYLIFLAPPVRINIWTMAFGRRPMQDSFSWHPEEGLEVIIVPIDSPGREIRFKVDPFHLWHIVNAYEENDRIVIDYIGYPDFSTNQWFGNLIGTSPNPPAGGRLERLNIDIGKRMAHRERLLDLSCEFPSVAPEELARKHGSIYLAAHSTAEASCGWWDRLIRYDSVSGTVSDFGLEEGWYPSEPVLTPAGKDGERMLLSYLYDSNRHRTGLGIWDAQAENEPPKAVAWFGHHIPFTFHGCWNPASPTTRPAR